ncbi:MAG: beta-ketoacyl reductase, partial [Blastocatellia bacterium]
GALTGQVWSHALLRAQDSSTAESFIGDVSVHDTHGRLLVQILGLQFRQSMRSATPDANDRAGTDLLYRLEWKPAMFEGERADDGDVRTWLIFGDRNGIGLRLARSLEEKGHRCCLFEGAPDEDTLRQAIAETFDDEAVEGGPHGVVYLAALDARDSRQLTSEGLRDAHERYIGSALSLIHAMASRRRTEHIPIYFVTQGAVPVLPINAALSIAQVAMWGFARAVSVEHPETWGGLIDLDPAESEAAAARGLLKILLHHGKEDMIAIRGGSYYVPRVAPEANQLPRPQLTFTENGTYLIIGGTGGLGRKLALWVSERGARHLCIVGRSASEQGLADLLGNLRSQGVNVKCVQADIASADQCERVLSGISAGMPELRGVFHLAGVLDDSLLVNETRERITAIQAGKVEGAWNLHRMTSNLELDAFVMFSSAATLLTMPGQANYVMANAFLDGLAHYRRGQGLRALSVNWGPLAGAGHAETEYGAHAHERLESMGIHSVSDDNAFEMLGRLMRSDLPQVAVIDADWNRVFRAEPSVARSPAFSHLAKLYGSSERVFDEVRGEAVQALRELPESERHMFLVAFLARKIGQSLKLGSDFVIGPRQKLFEIGLDSIIALELKTRLERSFDRTFSATLLFLYPTLESLADYLLKEVTGASYREATAASAATDADAHDAIEAGSEDQMVRLLMQEIQAV